MDLFPSRLLGEGAPGSRPNFIELAMKEKLTAAMSPAFTFVLQVGQVCWRQAAEYLTPGCVFNDAR